MSSASSSGEGPATPRRPDAYTTGKSNCSSVPPRLSNKSNTWSMTQSGRALGLSTLLIITIGFKPRANAFCVTKRVCGIGPSCESTRRSTQSTIESTRSTSPPKSACPGVSTMLIRYSVFVRASVHLIAVFFARMVIPRSDSIAPESMTRSISPARSPRAPDCCKSLSTRVVLP